MIRKFGQTITFYLKHNGQLLAIFFFLIQRSNKMSLINRLVKINWSEEKCFIKQGKKPINQIRFFQFQKSTHFRQPLVVDFVVATASMKRPIEILRKVHSVVLVAFFSSLVYIINRNVKNHFSITSYVLRLHVNHFYQFLCVCLCTKYHEHFLFISKIISIDVTCNTHLKHK